MDTPRYAFAVVQGCALSYSDARRPGRALSALALVPRLPSQEILTRSDRLRLRWTKGRLLIGLERFEEAVQVLDALRNESLVFGDGVVHARVSLEAAVAHLSLGGVSTALECIAEAVALFQQTSLEQDKTAALLALRQAIAVSAIPMGAAIASLQRLGEARS